MSVIVVLTLLVVASWGLVCLALIPGLLRSFRRRCRDADLQAAIGFFTGVCFIGLALRWFLFPESVFAQVLLYMTTILLAAFKLLLAWQEGRR